MKNQLDLILVIVSIVLAGIFAGVFYATKREVAAIPNPEVVPSAPLKLPVGNVKMTTALPGGSGAAAGGGGGGGQPRKKGGAAMVG